MKKRALLLALCLIGPFAQANDSAFEAVGGSPRPLQGENARIRMQSERIVLTVGRDGYDTRAEFVFVNDSNRRTDVMMGFPEENSGDVASGDKPRQTTFKRFATRVDGASVRARRIILAKPDPAGFVTYWVKNVSFAPRQTRRVRVDYRSPFGATTSSGFNRAIYYNFTGGNWKGKVARTDLEVRFSQPGLWRVFAEAASAPVSMNLKTRSGEAILSRTWRDWEAQTYFLMGLSRAIPLWMEEPDMFMTPVRLQKSLTFRVGAPSGQAVGFSGYPPAAFVKDGVTYVSVLHLEQRLMAWRSDARRENLPVARGWEPESRRVSLRAGERTLSFQLHSREMQVRSASGSQKVTLPAPAMALQSDRGLTTYVPLVPVAKALGFGYEVTPSKHALVLSRGAWPA